LNTLRSKLLLYGITDRRYIRDLRRAIKEALDGGVTAIQIREKNLPDGEFLREVEEVKRIMERYDALLFVNDRPDIAVLSGADGVHLGKEDLPGKRVKETFGILVGKTVKRMEDIEEVDYLACGPFFPSSTKPGSLLPISFLQELTGKVTIPVIAVGGITHENAHLVLEKGACGIAVSRSLFEGDVYENAKKLRKVVEEYVAY